MSTKLRNENEELKKQNEKLQGVIDSVKAHLDDEEHVVISTPLKYAPIVNAIERLKKQNAELKEETEGIMNEEGTQHILGINAYEKFCQAMCELNFDEDMISEMKTDVTELKEKIAELQTDLEDEKEEHANTEYDLEKLRESLEPLDEMMDKIKDVNEYEHVVDYVNGLHGKNIELKEASLIQFTRAQKYYESINELQEKYENEESTNKMLNEAIINHTEMLDELRTYLSNFDGDEVEVFDKIVKGSTD